MPRLLPCHLTALFVSHPTHPCFIILVFLRDLPSSLHHIFRFPHSLSPRRLRAQPGFVTPLSNSPAPQDYFPSSSKHPHHGGDTTPPAAINSPNAAQNCHHHPGLSPGAPSYSKVRASRFVASTWRKNLLAQVASPSQAAHLACPCSLQLPY